MEKTIKKTSSSNNNNSSIWDCGSSLYDSFELKSFEKQLDSAIISSRTMSMPHLSDRRHPPPTHTAAVAAARSKKPASKISRSLQRLIRSVFRPRNKSATLGVVETRFYGAVYDKSAALSAIPEAPEFDGLSPEIGSLVRRTTSDRFTVPTAVGIYCA